MRIPKARKSTSKPKVVHPLVVAVKKLIDDNRYRQTPYKYAIGDQVRVKSIMGEEWVGEVCFRTHDWYTGSNRYEVSNAPRLSGGVWLPAAYEYEMQLIAPKNPPKFFGFDIFDKVRVESEEHGTWTGYVLSFRRDGDEHLYEIENAPAGQDANGVWHPFVTDKDMYMIKPGFPTPTNPTEDWE